MHFTSFIPCIAYSHANACSSYCVFTCTVGMGEVHCGVYPVAFEAGSVAASVNVIIMNDEVPECDETFTADIAIGDEMRMSGFRLGPRSSASLTVKDDDSKYYYMSFAL